jgi:hypothetical protein
LREVSARNSDVKTRWLYCVHLSYRNAVKALSEQEVTTVHEVGVVVAEIVEKVALQDEANDPVRHPTD